MVKDIELPSLTEVVDGVIKQIWDKLLTVTVELVATTVPEVDPVLIDRLKVSADPLSSHMQVSLQLWQYQLLLQY